MYTPFLTRQTALEFLGTPDRIARFSIHDGDEIRTIHKHIFGLIDYATQKGEDFTSPSFAVDQKIVEPIHYLNNLFNRRLLTIIDKSSTPPVISKEPGEEPNIDFIACTTFEEVLMNAIEHGFDRQAYNGYSTVNVEAYSSNKGIAWIVAQNNGGQKFIDKIEPVLSHWPPTSLDLRYRNSAGRLRGNGLTRFIDPRCKDQVNHRFFPPNGLEVLVLKQFTDNSEMIV